MHSPILRTVFCFTSGGTEHTQKHPLLQPLTTLQTFLPLQPSESATQLSFITENNQHQFLSLAPIANHEFPDSRELFPGGGGWSPLPDPTSASLLCLPLSGLLFQLLTIRPRGIGAPSPRSWPRTARVPSVSWKSKTSS